MNLKKRLESLEAASSEVIASWGDAKDELKRELIRIAERARNTPLDTVLQDPSPITAYAMLCDGRVNDRLVDAGVNVRA